MRKERQNDSKQCPKCGCQILDPFGWGIVIHNIKACKNGVVKVDVDSVNTYIK